MAKIVINKRLGEKKCYSPFESKRRVYIQNSGRDQKVFYGFLLLLTSALDPGQTFCLSAFFLHNIPASLVIINIVYGTLP